MKLIIGLGNPGEKYINTRHNVGFLVMDKIANSLSLMAYRLENQFKSETTQTGGIGENRVIIAKPQTFMNLSGEAVSKLMQYYKIGLDDLIVVCDDLDLPLGTIRIRLEGSSGGHNGLQSIIDKIGNKFTRIRVGIGSNRKVTSNQLQVTRKNILAEEFVLQNFTKDETKIIDKSIDKTVEILLEWTGGKELREGTVKLT